MQVSLWVCSLFVALFLGLLKDYLFQQMQQQEELKSSITLYFLFPLPDPYCLNACPTPIAVAMSSEQTVWRIDHTVGWGCTLWTYATALYDKLLSEGTAVWRNRNDLLLQRMMPEFGKCHL